MSAQPDAYKRMFDQKSQKKQSKFQEWEERYSGCQVLLEKNIGEREILKEIVHFFPTMRKAIDYGCKR